MPKTKYVIIIPILTTILMFASIGAIIGNSILLSAAINNESVGYNFNELQSGDVVSRTLVLPSSIDDPALEISVSYFGDGPDGMINIYLMEERLPADISNISALEGSTFYENQLVEEVKNFQYTDTIYLQNPDDILYLVIGNIHDQTLDINLTIVFEDPSQPSSNVDQIGRILGIVFSSILTLVFFIGSLYLWMEYVGRVEKRILTENLERNLEEIQEKSLTWELLIFGVATVLAIIGYSELLVGGDSFTFVISIIGFFFTYYNYSKRQKFSRKIEEVLISHREISLEELSKIIVEDKDETKKALLDGIMYNNLPADFDFKTEQVVYNPNKVEGRNSDVIEPEPVQEATFQIASTEVQSKEISEEEEKANMSRAMPVCAYCDTVAISVKAQFCHACGASMSSAK